jgi:hypothetical protein
MRPEDLAKVAVTVSSEPGSGGCWCAAHDSVSGRRRRVSNRRLRRPGFSSAVRRLVPVCTFGDWSDPPRALSRSILSRIPDLRARAALCRRWVLTDIATDLTELAIELLVAAIALFPFPCGA